MTPWKQLLQEEFPTTGSPYDRYLQIADAHWNSSVIRAVCVLGMRAEDHISLEYEEKKADTE